MANNNTDKYYTDGTHVVQAPHRAGAFDKLQDSYGHSDIGDIFTCTPRDPARTVGVTVQAAVRGTDTIHWTYNPQELLWRSNNG